MRVVTGGMMAGRGRSGGGLRDLFVRLWRARGGKGVRGCGGRFFMLGGMGRAFVSFFALSFPPLMSSQRVACLVTYLLIGDFDR